MVRYIIPTTMLDEMSIAVNQRVAYGSVEHSEAGTVDDILSLIIKHRTFSLCSPMERYEAHY